MKVDIRNLNIAVARKLSLHALFFTNTIDQKYVKKWRLFVRKRIHIRILPNKKYKSVMDEHSHKFSNALYSH